MPADDPQEQEAAPDRAQERAARRGSQSSPDREPEEVRYSVEQLTENPRLVNTNARAIAGAFHGVTEPKTFTLEQAAERVNDFLKRPAATEEATS